ncbi:MAG TPA: ABC transporter permease [Candidatus Dormibacteraeota bacterium]|jgi:putative ABC transport system permease protein|nr:ABC transporter permease [Candidatus Dormibacteraeota bacterium]
MNVLEALRLAYGGLTGNRLRSALTMLGILIGVGAVILLVAFGNGSAIKVQSQINSLGSNLIYVYPSSSRVGGVSQGFGSGQTLTQADVQAIASGAPDVSTIIPVSTLRGQMTYQSQNYSTSVTATTQDFPTVRSYQISDGSFFTAQDVSANRRVVILGQTTVASLFGTTEPVGKSVKINRQIFQVVGVFAAKGTAGTLNQDDIAVVPISTAWTYLEGGRGKNINQLVGSATSANTLTKAETEITAVLLQTHNITDPTQPDFSVLTQNDIANAATSTTATVTTLLSAIAAISLVVGGIGIMNIMLVTVTERTREIGIRKAIGARRRDVLLQFLIESMFLSGTGGLAGILLGAGGSQLLDWYAQQPSVTFAPPVVSAPSVLLAFGVSVGIGLFFGIYPANRAAGLSPIAALRYE